MVCVFAWEGRGGRGQWCGVKLCGLGRSRRQAMRCMWHSSKAGRRPCRAQGRGRRLARPTRRSATQRSAAGTLTAPYAPGGAATRGTRPWPSPPSCRWGSPSSGRWDQSSRVGRLHVGPGGQQAQQWTGNDPPPACSRERAEGGLERRPQGRGSAVSSRHPAAGLARRRLGADCRCWGGLGGGTHHCSAQARRQACRPPVTTSRTLRPKCPHMTGHLQQGRCVCAHLSRRSCGKA